MQDAPTDGQNHVTLAVEGMNCGGCARAVENAIREVPGVRTASIDLAAKRAKVEGDNLHIAALVEAVQDAGFDARPA
jgi:copper chaperone CopZ